MTLSIAVRKLRSASGLSQQAFAQRVGLSLRAIANYEKERTPTARSLVQFARLATHLNRPDLASVFASAFQIEVDAAIDISDELQHSILITIHENNGQDWLDCELAALIRKARGGAILAHPLVFTADREPDQDARLRYLESLLIELRLRRAPSAATLLEEMATERVKQTGESKELATLELLKRSPELYARYSQERAGTPQKSRKGRKS